MVSNFVTAFLSRDAIARHPVSQPSPSLARRQEGGKKVPTIPLTLIGCRLRGMEQALGNSQQAEADASHGIGIAH